MLRRVRPTTNRGPEQYECHSGGGRNPGPDVPALSFVIPAEAGIQGPASPPSLQPMLLVTWETITICPCSSK